MAVIAQQEDLNDAVVLRDIASLRQAIQNWAERHDLWMDCGFKDYLQHVGGEPTDPPIATLLVFDGPLWNVFVGEDSENHQIEFAELIEALGFEYAVRDSSSVEIYPSDPARTQAFARYMQWQWVCGLIQEDFADIHHELFDHFAKRPGDLHRLHWREYEILLFRLFQNQGFQAELGPGRGDEGVDIRLVQRDPIGDILTIVQAKRYGLRNQIGLDAVAALYGIGHVDGADKALFVTTSRYAPVARRFAARTSGYLTLTTSQDVVSWCETATAGIVTDKTKLISQANVSRMIAEIGARRDPRIVMASGGYNMTINRFALVIKESRHAALLMSLPKETVSDDGYGQMGSEIPALRADAISHFHRDSVWRAKRTVRDGEVSYWDGRNLYAPWNGQAAQFNYVD